MKGKRLLIGIKAAMLAALFVLCAVPVSADPAAVSAPTSKKKVTTNQRKVKATPAKNSFATPDFAYPETVEKNATPEWNRALAKHDGLLALQAGLQLVVANNLVNSGDFNKNIEMLDSAVKVMPPLYASLFRLLQADLYADLYNRESWKYNQRVLPTDSFPADPKTWSRDLFAKKVFGLVMKAADNPAESRKIQLRELSPVLENSQTMIDAGCSVNDFIVFKSTEILEKFSRWNEAGIIPFTKQSSSPAGLSSQCAELSNSLINTLISYREREGNLPALALAVERKSELITGSDDKYVFLKEWKDKLKDSAADARVLTAYYNVCRHNLSDDDYDPKELYSSLNAWLQKFSGAEGEKAVRFCLESLTQPKMSVLVPSEILPGKEIKGSVNFENTDKGYLLIYSVPFESVRDGSFNVSKFPGNARFLKSIPVSTEGIVPFSKTVEITLDPLHAGYYVVVPSPKPTLPSNWKQLVERWSIQPINVTEIAILANYNSLNSDSGKIYVVSSSNQKPVKGATVSIIGQNDKVIKTGLTDEDGSFRLPEGYSRTLATFNNSHASSYSGFHASKSQFKPEVRCNILTDLSIYRPGDEVKFVLVEWMREEHSNRLLPNEPISVVMRDANWNPVDTLKLVTDSDGRTNGSFRIPTTGLLGSYSLTAMSESRSNNMAGRTNFEVADYKTPGFIVNLEKGGESSFNAGDTISFSGSVKTYSGMPLSGAEVNYKVTWEPWWRWGGNYSNASYGGKVVADSDGRFSITLPTEGLRKTRFEHGIFTIHADATSASGETQAALPVRFSLGKDFSVRPSFSDNICVEGDSIHLNVPVYDILGLPVIKNVNYVINRLGSEDSLSEQVVCKGEFLSPNLDIKSADIPSGKYRICFTLEGDTLKTNRDLVVFRKDDLKPPYSTPLWVPQTTYIASPGSDTVDVKFGAGYPDSWILAVVSSPEGIISRKWINISDQNTHLSLPAPKEGTKTWLSLSGLRDFEQVNTTITINPSNEYRKLNVKASSFRDKLTAGANEKWKFTFTVEDTPIKDIPAFAVMTDKALNAIAPFTWSFVPGRGFVANRTVISHIHQGAARMSANFSVNPKYYGFNGFLPSWNTYGYGLGMNGVMRMRVMSTSRSLNVKGGGAVLADEVHDEVFSVANDVEEVAPMMMKSANVNAAVKEEGVLNEDCVEYETDAGGASAADSEQLRPMEMPLAFFMPDLKGDKNGNVEVEFEVPNFNTTWQFQIIGYTPDLLTANLMLDAVASKSVMVQTNAPRFLRTGDKAEISALIFNNSEKTEKLSGEITIFNPFTGETIYSFHQGASEVNPSGNRQISINFDVPADITSIGIRTVGSSDKFSDGEQTVIPVLPSSTPLIESTQFYLGRNKNLFTVKLPKYTDDANLTLRYCSNPVWECILALPSITSPDSKNVLTLMHSLYANLTADGIVARYPEVKKELVRIFADKEKQKDALTSNLEKDETLKSVELVETPWVNNAASETRRLRSLSDLLEDGKAQKASEELLKEVKSLQNSDGGWSWCSGMQSSEYISRSVLARFSMIKRNGNLSAEANSMVKKGINYCDKKVYEDYVKSKHQFSTYDMLDYLYIRSGLDAGNGSTGFSSLKGKALKAIAEEWKGFGISEKAVAAMVMARSKGYERYAGEILESLRQYAVKDENKGWQFANIQSGPFYRDRLKATTLVLEAFAEIEPKAEAVDGLRQWLVLQKETEDWGVDSNTVEVIQAILDSGTDWTEGAPVPEIRIGGKVLEFENQSQPSGLVTVTLDPRKTSGKELTILKNSVIPTWGAVISQYVAPIREVKNERCENLKIEKQILSIDANGNGEKAIDGDLKVGDKVRVTLTVTCDKDMDYVAIVDERPACLAPDEQLSGFTFNDGRGMYREVRDTRTTLFLYNLPKGVNVFSYDCHVDRAGDYANGIATVQSLYSPQQVAHSAGKEIAVK